MRFSATPVWVSLSAVVGASRDSWLRAPGADPRHSWLGSAGGGGVWSLATPGCGSRSRFPATPGWGVRWWGCWLGPCHSWLRVSGAAPRHSWAGSAGRGWGFPVLCMLVVRRVRVVPVLVCVVCCVFLVSVLVVVWAWAGLTRVFVCVCVCACVVCWWHVVWCGVVCWWGCGWCVVWLVPRHSWRRFLCATPRHSWLGFAAGGGGRSSPLGLGGGSPPLHGGGPPAAAVGVSAAGGFPCCVCLWRGACWCVRCVFVAVVLVWVCLPCVLARVWRRVWCR